MPVIGYISGVSADTGTDNAAAFCKGLGETGYAEGQNVTIEYHWLEGQYDRLPALMADLVRRRVAAIVTPTTNAARAAKAATATIPIVFGVAILWGLLFAFRPKQHEAALVLGDKPER